MQYSFGQFTLFGKGAHVPHVAYPWSGLVSNWRPQTISMPESFLFTGFFCILAVVSTTTEASHVVHLNKDCYVSQHCIHGGDIRRRSGGPRTKTHQQGCSLSLCGKRNRMSTATTLQPPVSH